MHFCRVCYPSLHDKKDFSNQSKRPPRLCLGPFQLYEMNRSGDTCIPCIPCFFVRMYPHENYDVLVTTSTVVTVPVCIFLFVVTIFLMNLLIAQLCQSYHDAYSNMQAAVQTSDNGSRKLVGRHAGGRQ